MTTAQVIKTSVTVSNSAIQDHTHPADHTPPNNDMTRGLKPFTISQLTMGSLSNDDGDDSENFTQK